MNDFTASSSILVVDDEISLRNTFTTFLVRAGYRKVEAVATYEEAVRHVSETEFDLIICDIVLENHSGIDLLKKIRAIGVECPVVMITGYPQVETASEAVRFGAFDYLAKPVEKDPLLKTARLAISHFNMEKEKQKAEQSQRQAREFLETLFASVSDAIISIDSEYQIIQANTAAVDLLPGILSPSASRPDLKKTCATNNLDRLVELTQTVLRSGKKIVDHRLEVHFGDSKTLLSCCISPLAKVSDNEDDTPGAVLVIRDITYKLEPTTKERKKFHRLIGCSKVMHDIFLLIKNIGKVDTSVLVTGASGTGKELAAHALHQESSRSKRPFIKVDCTAIPDNLLESELFGHKKGAFTGATEDRKGRILQANGGTLFLDEIGDISATMQLRLLRFLQEKTYYPVGRDQEIHVDIRVIAATNTDLKEKVKSGTFREDLFYRLLVIEIVMPLLRERHGDITLLTEHFINFYANKMKRSITGISEQALTRLCQYHYPGNVRELEHIIERACVLCEETTISTTHLPSDVLINIATATPVGTISIAERDGGEVVESFPKQRTQSNKSTEDILEALRKAGGNKAKAARLLKIDRSTLYRKIQELHIDTDMFSF
jgi:two-component system response regulator HydG